MRLADWGFAFAHGYRYEASKLEPEMITQFEPFVKENMLSKPCQCEVIKLSKPFRVVLLFFFDKSQQDFRIGVRQEKWEEMNALISNLHKKYGKIQLDQERLKEIVKRCRYYSEKSVFAIDFEKNIFVICFTHDPRSRLSSCNGDAFSGKPYEIAETLFHLNLDQRSLYFSRNNPG